jgi:hypothetical protein
VNRKSDAGPVQPKVLLRTEGNTLNVFHRQDCVGPTTTRRQFFEITQIQRYVSPTTTLEKHFEIIPMHP